GQSPFARATPADTIASILEKEPPPLAQFTSEIPQTLERVILKALSKDREGRHQTAGELLEDLKSLKSGAAVIAPPTPKKEITISTIKRRRVGATIALAALIAVGAGAVYFSQSNQAIESIAVLPFTHADGNPETEVLADGITEDVINSLIQLS